MLYRRFVEAHGIHFCVIPNSLLSLLWTHPPVPVPPTRPNFMKIAPLMREYEKHGRIEPLLVHTGQHYGGKVSDLFFRDLGIPQLARQGQRCPCLGRLELKEGHVSFAVNRLYYSCFYAVTALLLRSGKQFVRHSAVMSEFNRIYVKTGKVDVAWSKFYCPIDCAQG
jgi:hypothetical protein